MVSVISLCWALPSLEVLLTISKCCHIYQGTNIPLWINVRNRNIGVGNKNGIEMVSITLNKCSARELKSLKYTELWFFVLWLSWRRDWPCGMEIHNVKALGSIMLGGKMLYVHWRRFGEIHKTKKAKECYYKICWSHASKLFCFSGTTKWQEEQKLSAWGWVLKEKGL